MMASDAELAFTRVPCPTETAELEIYQMGQSACCSLTSRIFAPTCASRDATLEPTTVQSCREMDTSIPEMEFEIFDGNTSSKYKWSARAIAYQEQGNIFFWMLLCEKHIARHSIASRFFASDYLANLRDYSYSTNLTWTIFVSERSFFGQAFRGNSICSFS